MRSPFLPRKLKNKFDVYSMLNSITNLWHSLLPLPFLEDISFLRVIGLVVDGSTEPETTSDNSDNEIYESHCDEARLTLWHCWRVSGIHPIKKRRTTFERRMKTESTWFLIPEKRELFHQFRGGSVGLDSRFSIRHDFCAKVGKKLKFPFVAG
jgi:hypothetical protein